MRSSNHTPADRWQLRTTTLHFGPLPALMGIVNATPDSFSDGGEFFAAEAAIEHSLQLLADGAAIVDVGGESTRPYADVISTAEQLRRVIPVIAGVRAAAPEAILSIDTCDAQVAREALAAGAEIINDVSALTGDPAMLPLAVDSGARHMHMHMQGTPQTMQDHPHYADVVAEVRRFLVERRDALIAAGIRESQICLDPGIGFGKTHEHNAQLMRHCGEFVALGRPVLVGHSRKRFLGKLVEQAGGDADANRDAATAGAAIACAEQGVQVLRVHDVRTVRDALAAWHACRP